MRAHAWGTIAVLLMAACKPAESACERLSKQFCADGSIDCGMVTAMFTAAKLPESACVEGIESMGALEIAAPETHSVVKRIVLEELLKQSPMLTAEQVDALMKDARGKAEANAAANDLAAPVFSGYQVGSEEKAEAPTKTPVP